MLIQQMSCWLKMRITLQRLLGYLRIGFSAGCGIICLLMIAWWVRSYSWMDGFHVKLTPSEYVQVHAGDGRMCIWFEHKPINQWYSWHANPVIKHTSPGDENRIPWLDIYSFPRMTRVYTAHWLLTVIAGSLAVI